MRTCAPDTWPSCLAQKTSFIFAREKSGENAAGATVSLSGKEHGDVAAREIGVWSKQFDDWRMPPVFSNPENHELSFMDPSTSGSKRAMFSSLFRRAIARLHSQHFCFSVRAGLKLKKLAPAPQWPVRTFLP